jgi:hypothetical protein
VVSDHGFTSNTAGVDVAGALVAARLKTAPDSTDVILASSGQAVAVHVEGHDAERIVRLARFIQAQDWGGVVFAAGPVEGPLELINVANRERSPICLHVPVDVAAHRLRGARHRLGERDMGGAPTRATTAAWPVNVRTPSWPGARSRKGVTVRAPAGNGTTPTALWPCSVSTARPASTAAWSPRRSRAPDSEQVAVETHVHTGRPAPTAAL